MIIDTNHWITLNIVVGPVPSKRWYHTSIVFENELWIFGGSGECGIPASNAPFKYRFGIYP